MDPFTGAAGLIGCRGRGRRCAGADLRCGRAEAHDAVGLLVPRRDHHDGRGGKHDGKGDAVYSAADLGNKGGILLIKFEVG